MDKPLHTPARLIAAVLAVVASTAGAASACNLCAYHGGTVVGYINSPVVSGSGSPLSLSNAGVQTLSVAPPPFNIVITPGATLAGNAPALAAFDRAAAQWEAFFSDPITVTINADMVNLGNTSTIGQTGSVLLSTGYETVRNFMISDALDEGTDDEIVFFLPSITQAQFITPPGTVFSEFATATKANLKAMGFGGLDTTFGISDGMIQFNTQFAFDFDRTDGIAPGFMDFETVAAHEIGHLLGFTSVVDSINAGATSISPNPLDFFRFQNDVPGRDPSTVPEFTAFPRYLIPGGGTPETAEAVFDDIDHEWRLSTGLDTGRFPNIDQRQASHWKDNDLTGVLIGMMDPTLAPQQIFSISAADVRAFDLMGYEVVSGTVVAPEPATLPLYILGGATFVSLAAFRRRRRRCTRSR